jgi:hypothetical protein
MLKRKSGVHIQSGPSVVGQSGIYLDACDRGRIQSSALEGYSISEAAIRLNAVSDTDIIDNFLEFYADAIRGETSAIAGIRVAGNHLHATGQVRLEFSIGSLPHERLVFEAIPYVLAAQDYCLKGIENIGSLVYESNAKTNATHFNPVTISPTASAYRMTAGPLVIDGVYALLGRGAIPCKPQTPGATDSLRPAARLASVRHRQTPVRTPPPQALWRHGRRLCRGHPAELLDRGRCDLPHLCLRAAYGHRSVL